MTQQITSDEIAFFCENEEVEIIPKQSLDPIEMAGWTTPPLRALRRVKVPLWFVKTLKQQDRCTIVFPKWLHLNELNKLLEIEQNEAEFAPLPWMWQPLSQILFKIGSQDYPNDLKEALNNLQELRELRLNKTRKGLELVNENHLRIDNLGVMEVQEIMPLISETMTTLRKLKEAQNA